jgi:hypothetical protein
MRAKPVALPAALASCALVVGACVSDEGARKPTQTPATYGTNAGYAGPGPYGPPPSNPNALPLPYGTPPPAPTYGPPAAPTTPWGRANLIERVDLQWLRGEAAALMLELTSVLPDDAKRRVQSIPIVVDDTPGEVNAFAACVRGGAVLSVSDGLLDIVGHLSAARASDELYRTRKVDEYIALLARYQKPRQPIPQPPAGFFDARQAQDPNLVRRAQEVLEETLGFVIGHELGHHRLGHLPCTGTPGLFGIGDIARDISGAVPIFNQPNELAADAAGTNNLLVMGARRTGYHLTEAGGLLVMQFFASVDQMSPEDILFSFDRTHPPPQVRVPVIQQTANFYRMSGGWLPVPGF